MTDLADIRREIDEVDAALTKLFVRRMKAVDRVAAVKRATGRPIRDAAREAAVLDRAAALAGPEFAADARRFFDALMTISRERENTCTTST